MIGRAYLGRETAFTLKVVFFFPILLSFYFALDKANITPVTKAKIALIQVSPVECDKFSETTLARKRIPQKNCDFVTFIRLYLLDERLIRLEYVYFHFFFSTCYSLFFVFHVFSTTWDCNVLVCFIREI